MNKKMFLFVLLILMCIITVSAKRKGKYGKKPPAGGFLRNPSELFHNAEIVEYGQGNAGKDIDHQQTLEHLEHKAHQGQAVQQAKDKGADDIDDHVIQECHQNALDGVGGKGTGEELL